MNQVDEVSLTPAPNGKHYTAVVAVAIPAGDMVQTYFAYDLSRMQTTTAQVRPDIKQHLLICKGSLIPKQRERLVADVLETDATHLLFLDSDMRFPKDLIVRLLAHRVPAVCAGYHERTPPHRPVAFATWDDFEQRRWTFPEDTGLEPIAACGLGCALFETAALREMPKPRFAVAHIPSSNGFAGEDVWFCQQLHRIGVTLLIDHDLTKEVRHIANLEVGCADAIAFARDAGTLPERALSLV